MVLHYVLGFITNKACEIEHSCSEFGRKCVFGTVCFFRNKCFHALHPSPYFTCDGQVATPSQIAGGLTFCRSLPALLKHPNYNTEFAKPLRNLVKGAITSAENDAVAILFDRQSDFNRSGGVEPDCPVDFVPPPELMSTSGLPNSLCAVTYRSLYQRLYPESKIVDQVESVNTPLLPRSGNADYGNKHPPIHERIQAKTRIRGTLVDITGTENKLVLFERPTRCQRSKKIALRVLASMVSLLVSALLGYIILGSVLGCAFVSAQEVSVKQNLILRQHGKAVVNAQTFKVTRHIETSLESQIATMKKAIASTNETCQRLTAFSKKKTYQMLVHSPKPGSFSDGAYFCYGNMSSPIVIADSESDKKALLEYMAQYNLTSSWSQAVWRYSGFNAITRRAFHFYPEDRKLGLTFANNALTGELKTTYRICNTTQFISNGTLKSYPATLTNVGQEMPVAIHLIYQLVNVTDANGTQVFDDMGKIVQDVQVCLVDEDSELAKVPRHTICQSNMNIRGINNNLKLEFPL